MPFISITIALFTAAAAAEQANKQLAKMVEADRQRRAEQARKEADEHIQSKYKKRTKKRR